MWRPVITLFILSACWFSGSARSSEDHTDSFQYDSGIRSGQDAGPRPEHAPGTQARNDSEALSGRETESQDDNDSEALNGSATETGQGGDSETQDADVKSQQRKSFICNFRPVYITTGIPLEGPVNKGTADVKFQISFGIPLWKGIGGKEDDCMLFLGYTQGCIWNFYDKSSPMRDNMFAPGIYFNLPFRKDNLLLGIEHRSNGRPFQKNSYDTWDTDRYSRSVNHIMLEYTHSFDFGLTLQANLRGGYGWYGIDLCQDIYYKFFGYGTLSAMYETPRKVLCIAASATPTFEPFDCNLDVEMSVRPFRKDYLPVIFIQYHRGWDFAMCDWVRGEPAPSPALRIGIMFTPRVTPFRLSR